MNSFLSLSLIYGFGFLFIRGISFLLLPVYTNLLSTFDAGIIFILYTILAFLNPVFAAGLDSALFKFYNSKEYSKENINQLLSRLLENFSEPQQAQDFQIPVSLSLGISLSPQMGTDFEELMRFADKAMYEAKNTTGFCYKYYSE
jgi:hypothetical protein